MLNYFANFRGELGYTILSRELFMAMTAERPDDITAVPYDPPGNLPLGVEYKPQFERTPDVKNGVSLGIQYGNTLYRHAGRKRIGYTMWETTKLPPGWTPCLNQLDMAWTLSEWGKEVFIDNDITVPLGVVPGGVRPEFNPYAEPIDELKKLKQENFVFLSVFKWEKRKSPDMLLQAFTEEFTEYENASLLLLAYNPFLFSIESWADKQYQLLYDSGIKKDPRIHFLPWFPTHDWLPRIYNSAHAFVLPSRGEGFGLPYIEAMACGLPTIGTNWSGNTEFMTKDNSWLIDVEYMEGADMPPFIFPEPGSTWAYPSKDSLKAHMRDIFDNREKATTKALKASEYIHNHFEWKHAAKKAWRYVDDLS